MTRLKLRCDSVYSGPEDGISITGIGSTLVVKATEDDNHTETYLKRKQVIELRDFLNEFLAKSK